MRAHTHEPGQASDAARSVAAGGPWVKIVAVVVLLICVDLALALGPTQSSASDPNPSSSADIRASLESLATAAGEGRPALLLIGDSVLAGDVMASTVEDWRSQRVVDHMRAELSYDSDAEIQQVALDGLLPIDALHLVAELDRVDPRGEVDVVFELNLRYFSREYGRKIDCTREQLCELGRVSLSASPTHGSVAAEIPELTAGSWQRAAIGLAEAGGLGRDWLVERTPVHRHRQRLRQLELDGVQGLLVRRDPQTTEPPDDPQHRAQGLARVQEHYRRSTLTPSHAQVQALDAILDRLQARGRKATLFLTPLEDPFVRATLRGNRLTRRYEQIATLVNDRRADPDELALINLDHPAFEPHAFLDHVHLRPEGNRLLAINLLHELGLPLRSRPLDWMLVHSEDHDRTLVHRRGTGYADGAGWEALLRDPRGVAVSPDGSWIVIADTGNHALRQLRGNMQFLERLAGKPTESGRSDGEALEHARLTEPRSPEIVGERVYFIDGETRSRVRELADGFVRTLAWDGPTCAHYDVLEAGQLDAREWLYLLCADDRILSVDLAAARATLISSPRAPVLADPQTGAPRGYETIEPTHDGRLLFADGSSAIWQLDLRSDGRARAPRRVYDNQGEELIPDEFGQTYPFGFDEMRFEQIVDMEWVERYGALLIQDQQELGGGNSRLHREQTERIHLRLVDLDNRMILPWIKAIPHSEAFHMWNAKTENFVSYYHLGAMAIARDDASLVWVEHDRSRVFRLADGLLGVQKTGNLHTHYGAIHLFNPISSEGSAWVGNNWRPDRFMGTRHEPIPRRGPFVALMVGSSMSSVSDRIGSYSLGRRLELELQAELGVRDNIRLDLFQRTASAAAFYYSAGMFEEFVEGGGPPPDVLLFELHDFNHRFFRGTKTQSERIAQLGKIEALAARYGTLVIFYDNSAIQSRLRDGLRHTHRELRELIADAKRLGFVVLEPSDWLLRELLSESPWGSQPWASGGHHGSAWAIDLTARALAAMSYPVISEFLREREPARLSERDPSSFDDGDPGERLLAAFEGTMDAIDQEALLGVSAAYMQRAYESRQVRIYVDLSGFEALGRSERELELVAVSVLYAVLVDEVYGELATAASIELLEFANYDEYGAGVLDSASAVWSRSFDRASLEQFLQGYVAASGGPE
ncbi:hypothetical protein [Enhygromyxa salina]|uniref:Uncharacterized protein n=1 Tax=Enhygromyxa salina TaxID=215803 RepID=A0A2S9YXM8_9BACT|nr:hypothetical protein [Enhygromyxa salina]PRQ09841.1 hypothetical protein ENSA7_03910 [Enhygromyxa salina]